MALTKVTGQVIKNTTDVTVGVLTVTNTLAVGGTVSIGGTLTYEDVTNVDSVGLITARNGIIVGSGVTLSKDGDGFFTGVVTATSYAGDGSALTGIAATDNVRTGILDVAGVGTFRNDVNIPDKIIHLGDTDTALRFPAADTFTVETGGSERVRVTSDGKLALGVTSPVAVVHIEGGSEGNLFQLSNTHTGTTVSDGFVMGINSSATYIFNRENTPIRIGTNNTEAVRIDSSGRVLIGTTTSGYSDLDDLTISTSGNTGITIRSGTSNLGVIGFADGTSGNAQYRGIIQYSHSGDFMQFNTADAERLRIDSSGRMGLGTILQSDAGSAGAGLKIETYLQRNTIYAFPDGYYAASLGEVNNTQTKVWASIDSHYNQASAVSAGLFLSAFHADAGGSGSGSAIKNLKSGNALTFSSVTTASSVGNPAVETERLRIDSSGRLLLGTTTSNAAAGSLHVKNAYIRIQAANQTSIDFTQQVGIEWSQEEGSDVQVGKIVMRRTGWGGAPHSMDFYSRNSSNQVQRNMTIDHDGGIYFQNLLGNAASGSAVKYNNSDDELRYDTSSKLLKTNITELTKYGIDTVKKLKPSTFTPQEYNKDGTITVGSETLIGFIADEMVTEVPEVVQMYPKSTLTKQEEDTEIVPAAISYDKLTVVLTKALQEAIAKIETLETEVAALKSQLNN